jgi:hypothetical protein
VTTLGQAGARFRRSHQWRSRCSKVTDEVPDPPRLPVRRPRPPSGLRRAGESVRLRRPSRASVATANKVPIASKIAKKSSTTPSGGGSSRNAPARSISRPGRRTVRQLDPGSAAR